MALEKEELFSLEVNRYLFTPKSIVKTLNIFAFYVDSAHCHSPAGGQGMNLGLQDGKRKATLFL